MCSEEKGGTQSLSHSVRSRLELSNQVIKSMLQVRQRFLVMGKILLSIHKYEKYDKGVLPLTIQSLILYLIH